MISVNLSEATIQRVATGDFGLILSMFFLSKSVQSRNPGLILIADNIQTLTTNFPDGVVSPKFSKKAGHGRWLGDET